MDRRLPFTKRFADYCRAFARLLVSRGHGEEWWASGERFYTPINEISYFAYMAGDRAEWLRR